MKIPDEGRAAAVQALIDAGWCGDDPDTGLVVEDLPGIVDTVAPLIAQQVAEDIAQRIEAFGAPAQGVADQVFRAFSTSARIAREAEQEATA
jgi:hypothetical protein